MQSWVYVIGPDSKKSELQWMLIQKQFSILFDFIITIRGRKVSNWSIVKLIRIVTAFYIGDSILKSLEVTI